jgi:hypothetical protein
MATPRTGRPRGRPPKPKAEAPAKDRGRPPKPLWGHPHRFRIAGFIYIEGFLRLDGRQAAKASVAAAFGEPAPRDPRRRDLERLSVPLSMEQFDRYADRLRKLASRYPKTAVDAIWLLTIFQAILIAHTLGPYAKEAAKEGALSYAVGVDEERWARETLLPWIDRMPTRADRRAERERLVAERKADRERLTRFCEDLLSQPKRKACCDGLKRR